MKRPALPRLGAILTSALLCACTPSGLFDIPGELSRSAREQLLATLTGQYTQRLGTNVNAVIADLGQPGGYLDNPVVRILLPPPVGLVLGVARDLRAYPQAVLLETLMNQVAEQVIPGAAPIVQAALTQITPAEARRLLDGDVTAGSEHLKARTAAALQTALQPVVAEKLANTGALTVYGELVDAYQAYQAATPTDSTVPPPEAAPALAGYVTERAIDGLFKTLGAREAEIRRDIERATGGMLQPGRNM